MSPVGQRVKARRAKARSRLKARSHEFSFSLPGECQTVGRGKMPTYEARATRAILAPLPPSQNPFQRYLQDTGTGHRLVHSRVISLPGDPVERLQVALDPVAGQLGAELAVPSQEDMDLRPVVKRVKQGSKAEACGLRKGHRLASVAGHHADTTKPGKLMHLISAPRSEMISAVFELPPPKAPQADDLRSASWADIVNKHKTQPLIVHAPPIKAPRRARPKWDASLV